MKRLFFLLFSLYLIHSSFAQNLTQSIDSLLSIKGQKPFNGMILIVQNNKPLYFKMLGFADLETKTPLQKNDQFVIGSISKQITAALVLQSLEKGKIDLQQAIRTYLPDLQMKWADSVTVHHLLTHTDGIDELDKPLFFSPGTSYRYNQINFDLLAKILESVNHKPFAIQCKDLFEKLGMKHSYHPANKPFQHLVKGYAENEDGTFEEQVETYNNIYAAAGGLISSANDLLKWNKALHGGKIIKDKTYQMMITKQKGAVRQHPLFGVTEYGYGLTVDTKENLFQLGQTGYCRGFASMNFYFPETKTSLIILENVMKDPDELAKTFYYHVTIWKMLRAHLSNKNK